MSDLSDQLGHLAGLLDRLKAPWALVGGLAVGVHTEPRFTRDLDVVVAVADDAGAERIGFAFQQEGYQPFAVVEQEMAERMATVRLRPPGPPGPFVDLIFATSGIETEVTFAAQPADVFAHVTVPVARVGHLIAMKLLSSRDERPLDQADLLALRQVADGDEIALARDAVGLISARGFDRGRDLPALLDELVQHAD